MNLPLFETESPRSRAGIIPRDYQVTAHDSTLELFEQGTRGVMIRGFTGCGKTVSGCLAIDTWLQRSTDHRAMVVSYETQLVDQYAEEIEQFLGASPTIEMGDRNNDFAAGHMPDIIVASRASLLRATPPTEDQIAALRAYGINDPACAPKRVVERFLALLKKEKIEPQDVRDEIARLCMMPEAANGAWSRLHKFDWHYHWVVVFDEAHRHAYHLKSVGHIIDWFDQNPESRWIGTTATPKRGDGKSLGDKMFPGIALDYPLYKPDHPSGVRDGWAVPYVQRYIEVEGVDFAQLKKVAGDFDEGELERQLGTEEQLAALVAPLLDMVEDRRTLIFSPGVQMAKDVARYINARSRAVCICGAAKWFPTLLIGDGATCPVCGRMIEVADIDKVPDQAQEIDGTTPYVDRKQVYREHQSGQFQFLSVCGLCREGYNDPDLSCVAVFRPVSKKASSLAEQMKGRACRPLRGLLHADMTREERLEAIANSEKPAALIVDLVGITGLADCASTVQIYADGLPDEVSHRAEQILAEAGTKEEMGVDEAIAQAKREDAERKERVRQERIAAELHAKELAKRRAKADAQVRYTTHETGAGANVDSTMATDRQYHMMAFLGLAIFNCRLSKKQAGRIIDQLQRGIPLEEIAHTNRIEEWKPRGPSSKQLWALRGVRCDWIRSAHDASLVISARKNPAELVQRLKADISAAPNNERLDAIGRSVRNLTSSVHLPPQVYGQIVEAGRSRRAALNHTQEHF